MNSDNYIHIALLGPVSAGKTTLLNALLVARYGDMAMARTTMTEVIYYESSDQKLTETGDIHAKNSSVNKALYEKAKSANLTAADLKPIEHFVPPVHELLVGKLHSNVRLAIHDLPGLNDAQTKNIYYEYVTNNFHKYNIVILVLDVTSGMNTNDEKDILTLIANCISKNKAIYGIETSLIIAINKCDDMKIKDHNSSETVPTDPEYVTMVKQVRTTVESVIAKHPNIQARFACISAEDAYIYRMYSRNPKCVIDEKHRNKFGINEFGKSKWTKMTDAEKLKRVAAIQLKLQENTEAVSLAGFRHLDWKLANILTEDMQVQFLIAPIAVKLNTIVFRTGVNETLDPEVMAAFVEFNKLRQDLRKICELFKRPMHSYEFFSQHVKKYFEKFIEARKVFIQPMTVAAGSHETYARLKKIYEIIDFVYTYLFLDGPLDAHLIQIESVSANINSYIVAEVLDTNKTFDELNTLIESIIFPDHEVHPRIVKLLPCAFTDVTLNLGFDHDNMYQQDAIAIEMLLNIWKYRSIDWDNKICLIEQWIPDERSQINLTLHNLRIYLDLIQINGDQRWNACEVFSHYYINSNMIARDLDFTLTDIAKIKRHLYMQNPAGIVVDDNTNIAYVIRHCLSELNKLYPKHIVDLDAFYGAPRDGPSLDEFYKQREPAKIITTGNPASE